MPKILVSACLLGQKVRYDGRDNAQSHAGLAAWLARGDVIALCPEVAGGLSTPRAAAEIEPGKAAADVWLGKARVLTRHGQDVSQAYRAGAEKALELAKNHGIHVAILKARSPSCGSKQVYDGQHQGRLIEGSGVTAHLLTTNGVRVFDETEIDLALTLAEVLENT